MNVETIKNGVKITLRDKEEIVLDEMQHTSQDLYNLFINYFYDLVSRDQSNKITQNEVLIFNKIVEINKQDVKGGVWWKI